MRTFCLFVFCFLLNAFAWELDLQNPAVTGEFKFNKHRHGDFILLGQDAILEIPFAEDARTYDIYLRPGGPFSMQGSIDKVPFGLVLTEERLLCRGKNSPTMMVPAYNWRNGEKRLISICYQQDNWSFFVDGEPAVVSKHHDIDSPAENDYGLKLFAQTPLQVFSASRSKQILDEWSAAELFLATVNNAPRYPRPQLVIPEFAPPEKEQALELSAWENTAQVTAFVVTGSYKRAPRQARVNIGADSNGIYLLYRIPIWGEVKQPSGGVKGHDAEFSGDNVEFFFMPVYTEEFDYFQFVGNGWGNTIDYKRGDISWNGHWTNTAAVVGNEWRAFFNIKDFSSMGAPKPVQGAEWRLNFAFDDLRHNNSYRWTQWANTGGNYANHQAFAYARFGAAEEVYCRMLSFKQMELVNPANKEQEVLLEFKRFAPGKFKASEQEENLLVLQGGERKILPITLFNDEAGHTLEIKVSYAKSQKLIFIQSYVM